MQPTVQMRDVWTFEDLHKLDLEDRRRFEIIDGGLLVTPPPAIRHQFVSALIRDTMTAHLLDGHIVLDGTTGVSMSRSYLIPDLVVMPVARYREAAVLLPEDALVVVEIVSPGTVTLDRVVKPAKYAAAGIEHYWRVETDPISLTAYALPEGADVYIEVGTWGVGETAELTAPFPISIEIARLQPPGR